MPTPVAKNATMQKPNKANTTGVIARLQARCAAPFQNCLDVNETTVGRRDLGALLEFYEAEREYEAAEKEHQRTGQFQTAGAAPEIAKSVEDRFVAAGERRARARDALKR